MEIETRRAVHHKYPHRGKTSGAPGATGLSPGRSTRHNAPQSWRPHLTTTASRPIALWLLAVAALVFAMVVVGGVTRLTRSGLSIVEWQPIVGAIPPLNETQWSEAFDKYKQTPEYRHVNSGMALAEFKGIFYVEWAHRLLGRLIGFAMLLPLLYFIARRRIARALIPKLVTIFILGGLQGALGWFMVESGLVDIPRVNPYRLTAHLGLAVVIYAYLLWVAFGLLYPKPETKVPARLRRLGAAITALVFVTILAGGFVAGTRAGFAFNTFPLMSGRFVPEGIFALEPWWTNLFENIALVQFDHRLLAYSVVLAVAGYWSLARRVKFSSRVRWAFHLLPVAVLAQVALGIATLLMVVPVPLGAAHQAGALVVFTVALYLAHALRVRA